MIYKRFLQVVVVTSFRFIALRNRAVKSGLCFHMFSVIFIKIVLYYGKIKGGVRWG